MSGPSVVHMFTYYLNLNCKLKKNTKQNPNEKYLD